jgi:hypothetical protein
MTTQIERLAFFVNPKHSEYCRRVAISLADCSRAQRLEVRHA